MGSETSEPNTLMYIVDKCNEDIVTYGKFYYLFSEYSKSCISKERGVLLIQGPMLHQFYLLLTERKSKVLEKERVREVSMKLHRYLEKALYYSYKSIVLDQCTKNLPKKTFETYIISCFDTGVKKLMNYNFDKDFKTGFVAWTTANSETIKKQVSDIFKRHARTNNSTDSWTFTDFCRWALYDYQWSINITIRGKQYLIPLILPCMLSFPAK